MKILMIGAGAIGGVTAAYMTLAGLDVTLLCHRESQAELIRKEGLHIIGHRGKLQVKMNAVSHLTDTYDLCFIATKAGALEECAKIALPHLREDALLVSMQNGMCMDLLKKAVGPARSASCVVTWSCTMVSDDTMDFTGEGGFVVGLCQGGKDARIEAAAAALDKMAPTRISENILADIYSKLIINSAITCGGAMSGLTVGQMLVRKTAREFFIALVREDLALADKLGISVPPFGGKLDYYKFANGSSLRRHFLLFVIGLKYRRLTSSSLTSLRRGGVTEMPYLNGWISKAAAARGVSVPVNDAVVQIISEIEAGLRQINPQNIEDTLK